MLAKMMMKIMMRKKKKMLNRKFLRKNKPKISLKINILYKFALLRTLLS
jgi:hypothetical protein